MPMRALPTLDTSPARYQPVISKMIKIEPETVTIAPTVAAAMASLDHPGWVFGKPEPGQ